MISKNLKTKLKRLKNDLKEYVDIKVEGLRNEMRGLEKRLDMLSRFMLGTFIGIILTPDFLLF